MRALGTVVALSIRGAFAVVVCVAVACVIGVFLFLGWLTSESEVDTK